jgi:UDP:flavonoid glycosyltransferase YjiC (YdhE family)
MEFAAHHTSHSANASKYIFRLVLGGLASLPVNVVVATGPQITVDHLGEVPTNVTLYDWVPQTGVLEHADLVVHYGGSGTTLGAAARDIPQLIMPLRADQHANAAEIAAQPSPADAMANLVQPSPSGSHQP